MSHAFSHAWKTKSERLTFDEACTFSGLVATITMPCALTFYGKSSLLLKYTKRRSLYVELRHPLVVNNESWSKFMLLSLWEDKRRIVYRSCLAALNRLDLFFSLNRYAAVRCGGDASVCGKTLGAYLMVEDPTVSIHKRVESAVQGRRIGHVCGSRYFQGKFSVAREPHEVATRNWFYYEKPPKYDLLHVSSYKRNSSLSDPYKGLELDLMNGAAAKHNYQFDVVQYLTWVAFNTAFQNGDYDDEVFFFSAGQYMGIMAWDYDNVFSPCHRKGKQAAKTELIYCGETPIEKQILTDKRLNSAYLEVFRCVIEEAIPPRIWQEIVSAISKDLLGIVTSDKDIFTATFEEGCCPDIDAFASNLADLYRSRVEHLRRVVFKQNVTSFPWTKRLASHPRSSSCTDAEARLAASIPSEAKGAVSLNEANIQVVSLSDGNGATAAPAAMIDRPGLYCAIARNHICNASRVFVVRSKERGKTEFGVKHFSMPHLFSLNSFADRTKATMLVVTPTAWLSLLPMPVVCRLTVGDTWFKANELVAVDSIGSVQTVMIARGFSAFLVRDHADIYFAAERQGLASFINTTVSRPPSGSGEMMKVRYGLADTNVPMPHLLQIGRDTLVLEQTISTNISFSKVGLQVCAVLVTMDVTVEASGVLILGAGCQMVFHPGTKLTVLGTFMTMGSASEPVSLFPFIDSRQPDALFDSVVVTGQRAFAVLQWTFVVGGGGGSPRPGTGTHHIHSAALTVQAKARLQLVNSFIIASRGPAIAAGGGAKVTLFASLIQWAQLGIECIQCDFASESSMWTYFPDDTTAFSDLDNDGMYLSGGQHSVQDSVIASAKDDGIDSGTPDKHRGDGGVLHVKTTIIERVQHEALALSSAPTSSRQINVQDSLFAYAQQGIEMGYSGHELTATVSNVLVAHCSVGIRYGDNYFNRPVFGRLDVRDSILHSNVLDVVDYVRGTKNPSGNDKFRMTGVIARSQSGHLDALLEGLDDGDLCIRVRPLRTSESNWTAEWSMRSNLLPPA